MKRRSISLIVGLMTIALLGVMAMQLYFFRESYQLQSRLFDQSVNEALNNVIERIEKEEANKFLISKAEVKANPSVKPYKKPIVKKRNPIRPSAVILSDEYLLAQEQRRADSVFFLRDSLLKARYPNVLTINDALTPADLKDLQLSLKVDVMQFEDVYGRIHEQTRQSLTRVLKNKLPVAGYGVPASLDSVRMYVVSDPVEGTFLRTIPKPRMKHFTRPTPPEAKKKEEVKKVQEFLASENEKDNVIENLYLEYRDVHVPLNKRIHPQTLDSMLRMELENRRIFSKYEYKVTSAKRDSLIFRRASTNAPFIPSNTYQTALFPKDMIRDAGMLTITFPDKNNVILSNLAAMMSLSGALLAILIFCFGYTIHSILRQKKISEMKTDFINNMTHEFKTPVSTIMIASEALKDPDLTADKSRIERLAGIIYDENVRLGNHIERVLNIARIDKGDLKLEYKEVEVNDLLTAIVDSMSLQLQKRNANIRLNLNAGRSVIMGDELHVSNVIFNLLDNANKYSPENPEITLTTLNSGKNLIIRVADKGIGMSRDQLNKIFDQFYRIPTGNLHDVKGFGLGLSYVSNIVKRLHGNIKVKSEKGVGSEFEISLPLSST